jgi:HPt (histidine-containing phosphotransfer) domain-containing protein
MGLLQELVGAFFHTEYPQLLAQLRSAIATNDALGLRRAAHTLKGEVGNFGATAAYDAALQLETMGREESLAHAAEVCAVLTEAMARLHSALIALGQDEAS